MSWVAARIWWRVGLGALLSGAVTAALYGACSWYWGCANRKAAFCETVWTDPPWTLISGLAAAPALILLWQWQTTQRGQELELSSQAQTVSRFVDGLKLLGSSEPTNLLAGIFALEQVARNFADYQPTVVHTLSSFVRRMWPRCAARPRDHGPSDQTPERQRDIVLESAMKVLGRLGPPRDGSEWDLREVDLSGLDLRESNLQGVRLARADLIGVWLDGADLTGAVLNNADLWRAQLPSARLERAKLIGADARSANFTGAILTSAEFTGAKLAYAIMGTASAQSIRLMGATYNSHTQLPAGVDPKQSEMQVARSEKDADLDAAGFGA